MNWTLDYKRNTIVVDFGESLFAEEKAEKLSKRFYDTWNDETSGRIYRLDLTSVFVCRSKFCVAIDPWKNGGICDCLENFNQLLLDLAKDLMDD